MKILVLNNEVFFKKSRSTWTDKKIPAKVFARQQVYELSKYSTSTNLLLGELNPHCQAVLPYRF